MVEKTFNVKGMSCGHCKMAVENAVKALSGVNSAEVDLEAGNVSVSYDDDSVKPEQLKEAVETAGYAMET